MPHEPTLRKTPPSLPSNRQFGIFFTTLFAIVGLVQYGLGSAFVLAWLIAAAFTGVATVCRPSVLTPFNKAWFKLGALLHFIVGPLVLGVLFYGCITPFGLAMRALGKDSMHRCRKKELPSYWIVRTISSTNFTQQF